MTVNAMVNITIGEFVDAKGQIGSTEGTLQTVSCPQVLQGQPSFALRHLQAFCETIIGTDSYAFHIKGIRDDLVLVVLCGINVRR
jgi:hypothetical protein